MFGLSEQWTKRRFGGSMKKYIKNLFLTFIFLTFFYSSAVGESNHTVEEVEAQLNALPSIEPPKILEEWLVLGSTEEQEAVRLAENGNVHSQYVLGINYDYGITFPQNHKKARYWLNRAAYQGYDSAQYTLGYKYEHGLGVIQSYGIALTWYKLAAGQGVVSAQLNLGEMYLNGNGVPKSKVSAYKWFSIAGLHIDACHNKDLPEVNWCEIKGFMVGKKGRSRRDFVKKTMTPLQIAMAQLLASEWVREHE